MIRELKGKERVLRAKVDQRLEKTRQAGPWVPRIERLGQHRHRPLLSCPCRQRSAKLGASCFTHLHCKAITRRRSYELWWGGGCCGGGGGQKSLRREVVRSSAGAGVVYPPFVGSFA